MSREIVVSEAEKLAVVVENGTVREFYLSEGEQYVGDIILATVESIVPAIEAAFLNIGREKSGFIHVSDLPSSRKQQSGIRQYLKTQQQMLVQVTREPTGNKGACLTGFIQLPGRFLVLTPFERRIGLSKRIYDARERARLARIARMICGSGYGIVLRPEAVGQSEQTLRDDLKLLMGRWKHILASSDKQQAGTTLYRDQDILERILREGATSSVNQIIVDNQSTYDRAVKYFSNWSETKARTKLRVYNGEIPMLAHYGVYQQLEKAVQPLVQLPSGGTLVIEPTEALTSIDINTSSMTSTDNQPETILRTNCEAAEEIARQLVLRDIGGVIVIDFIDMDNPRDQQIVWQTLADKLQHDKAQPQISYFSEFGLVEMTRRRQRQRLSEMMTLPCPTCQGIGRIRNTFYRYDILSQSGVKMRTPVLQPDEKSARYQDGQEKQSSRRRGGSSNDDSNRSRNNGSKSSSKRGDSGRSSKAQTSSAPAAKEEKSSSRSSKAAAPEQPEDLLFDDSIFSSSITDELLENYIEREDKLNVSSRLANNLDNLIARIDDEGIESIKRGRQTDDTDSGRSKRKKASAKDLEADAGDDELGDLDSYIESEADVVDDMAEDEGAEVAGDDSDESDDASEDDKEAVAEEEEKPAKAKAKTRAKKTTRKTTAKKAKTTKAKSSKKKAAETEDADDAEESSDDVSDDVLASETELETSQEESQENAETAEESDGEEAESDAEMEEEIQTSSVSSASLAESALSTSSRTRSAFTKPKNTAKRPLTRRRTIRSFRPKR